MEKRPILISAMLMFTLTHLFFLSSSVGCSEIKKLSVELNKLSNDVKRIEIITIKGHTVHTIIYGDLRLKESHMNPELEITEITFAELAYWGYEKGQQVKTPCDDEAFAVPYPPPCLQTQSVSARVPAEAVKKLLDSLMTEKNESVTTWALAYVTRSDSDHMLEYALPRVAMYELFESREKSTKYPAEEALSKARIMVKRIYDIVNEEVTRRDCIMAMRYMNMDFPENALKSSSHDVRSAALHWLYDIDPERTIGIYEKGLNSKDEDVRHSALSFLLRHTDDYYIDAFLDMMLHSKDHHNRESLISDAYNYDLYLKDERILKAIKWLAENDPYKSKSGNYAVRETAKRYLDKIEGRDTDESYVEQTVDAMLRWDQSDRILFMETVYSSPHWYDNEKHIKVLEWLAENDPYQDEKGGYPVRKAAKEYLKKIKERMEAEKKQENN